LGVGVNYLFVGIETTSAAGNAQADPVLNYMRLSNTENLEAAKVRQYREEPIYGT
jgi:hypothetical protein